MGRRSAAAALVALVALVGILLLRAARTPGPPTATLAGPAFPLFEGATGRAEGPAPGPEAPPAPTSPDAGGGIRGIVVDGDGRPVAGAEVAAAREGERSPARCLAGTDGRFALPVQGTEAEFLIGARAPGLAPVLRGSVRPGGGELRIVLLPGARLSGRVRDDAGSPCAGARVRASLRFPGVAHALGGFETRADEEGAFAFEDLPAVEGSLEALHHGDASEPVGFSIPPRVPVVEVDLRVASSPSIAGRVRGPDGNPAAGVLVLARSGEGRPVRSTETDGEGAFRLGRLDPVPYQLTTEDMRGLLVSGPPRSASPGGEPVELIMEPHPDPPSYACFRIQEADGTAGRHLRLLLLRGDSPEPVGSTTLAADPRGLFRTGRLRPGTYRVEVRTRTGSATSAEFAVEPGRTTDLGTLRLAPAAGARGRLLDPSGAPAAGARVFVDDDPFPEPRAVSADGTFEVRGLPAGSGRLRILLAGSCGIVAPWRAAAGETADLGELRFRAAAGAFRGSVRSASGAPVEGARVRITPWGDIGPGSDERRLLAGPDGRFEATAIAAGRWVLSAAPPAKPGEDEERTPAPAAGAFSYSGAAHRIDLADGEQREVVLEIE